MCSAASRMTLNETDRFSQLLRDSLARRGRQVKDRHVRAAGREQLGRGEAKPGRTAGHERCGSMDFHRIITAFR